MKIGIYTHHIKEGESGGVQQYSTRLVNALVKLTNHDIYVFTNKQLANTDYVGLKKNSNYHEIIISKKSRFYLNLLFNNRIVKFAQIPNIINRIHSKRFFNFLFRLLGDKRCIVYSRKVDLIHIPSQTLLFYYWKIPTLITLHDLQHKYYPRYFSAGEIKARDFHYKKSCDECSQVVVSFNHVKNDIINFYNIADAKITVTSVGYDYKNVVKMEKDINISKKYNIGNNFLLYPAHTWKHKNHIFLLRVLDKYINKYNDDINLICTGKKNEHYKNIEKVIIKRNLNRRVKFIGFVSEEELNVLYKKTKLVVVPTLYESGSYPVIEAMARGTPVIGSNATSIPEIIGDDRFIFDPTDEDECCNLIYKIINDKKFKGENIHNSKKQAEKFKWRKIIENYLGAYKIAIANNNIN